MDLSPWISGVTALANVVKVWLDARTAGLQLDEARDKVQRAKETGVFAPSTDSVRQQQVDAVITPELLSAFLQDIQQAEKRFIASINDPRYTPADLDQESKRARLSICTHLRRIREFNNKRLPTSELEVIETSYDCKTLSE